MKGLPTCTRTQIGSIQRFVGQPYFEVTTVPLLVKLCDSQACSVDCYRITDVTVTQDGCSVGYGQRTPPCVALKVRNGAKMLDLDDIEHGRPSKGRG